MTPAMALLKFLFFALFALATGLAVYTYAASRWFEHLYPPLGSFIEVGGEQLHYLSEGEGQSIVLLHGASASLRDFEASFFHELAKDHQVIAIDRPGYGYSTRSSQIWPSPEIQADLIHQALATLKVKNPVIIGHSLAGSVVMAYLIKYPDSAAGAVLLAGATHSWDTGVSAQVQLAGIPIIGKLFASTVVLPIGQLVFDQAVKGVFAPEQPTRDYRKRTGAILALRPNAFQSSSEDIRNLSDYLERQAERYGEIETPLLMITGNRDTIVPAWNHADRVEQQVPQSAHVSLPDAGHALHHSRADDVVGLIRSFLSGLPSG